MKFIGGGKARRMRFVLPAVAALGLTVVTSGSADAQVTVHAQYLSDQWGLTTINAAAAWGYANGASGAPIGIIDTGVDTSQQDLAGQVVAAHNFNTTGGQDGCTNSTAQDDNGHGTHVAGIAAASGQYGVAGVDPGARLIVAKVLDCTGSGNDSDVAAGVNWAVSAGARVLNLSLGSGAFLGLLNTSGSVAGTPLGDALNNAWAHGVIPVVAGGNDSGGAFGLADPNYSGVNAVVVAATGSPSNGEADSLASYSNPVTSATWGVAAPGGDDPTGPSPPTCGQYDQYEILSTFWTSSNSSTCYATDEGTSMATPFVTGTLALLLSRGLTPSQAVQTLLNSSNHNVSCGGACSGLISAGAALAATGPPQSAAAHSPSTTTTHPVVANTPVVRSSAGPTTTAPSTTTSPPTSTSSPSPKVRAAGAQRNKSIGHGSILWLVIPILLGAALLAGLTWFVTRDRGSPLAMVQEPLGGPADNEVSPPPDISGGI